MTINEEAFLKRYHNLNNSQREAVDTIYGPVMVIAGPGTGKTEVLSVRIANLLRSEAQVQPGEILCLTYTEEATNSMRRRLVQIIGPAAHRVGIYTFHAFCNNIIQNHSEYFSQRSLQPVSDLERTELLYAILDDLPAGHVLRKLSGNIYFDVPRLQRLFDLMKRENLLPDVMAEGIDAYIADLPNREEYIYKTSSKNYKKGDLKQSLIDAEIRRMTQTKAAAALLEEYTQRMKEMGRYDFNDMILWVLDALKQHPSLLQTYQERYQFILVDEFQDTNGAQNELIHLLTQFWDDPNIFVVGDDDQSIYEFQGARIRNIIDFYQRFRDNIRIVVLPQNYRSSQAILDKATAAIQNNRQRLIYQLDDLGLTKDIVAANPRFHNGAETIVPQITAYPNLMHEEADVVMRIEALQQQGVRLNEIAVIYAQHKQADRILELMERKSIPYSVKKPVNVLDVPLTRTLIQLFRYLDEERQRAFSAEGYLFELMHAPWFGIEPTDIAQLSLYLQSAKAREQGHRYWRLLLDNALLLETVGIRSARPLIRLGHNLNQWLQAQLSLPLPMLLEKILHEGGIVAHLLKRSASVWDMQVLNTFFSFVKDEFDRNPRLRVPDLLRMIDRMDDEGISLPLQKVVQSENGVHFYTAHGAKGNEFEHVFLIGCTKNFWEAKKGGGNEYKLPDTITRTDDDTDKTYKVEVARRLFYVALTRARKHLYVSYALEDNNGKPLETSLFVDEISAHDERMKHNVAPADLMKHIEWAMAPVPEVQVELANHEWVEQFLKQLSMSYTNLSKYQRCPLAFYYESVLRVPFLKSDALSFGSSVHYALERAFKVMKENGGNFPGKEEWIESFEYYMFREQESFTPQQFERRQEQGRQVISDYYDNYLHQFSKNIEVEFKIPRYYLDGVPVTGKIDKMEFEGNECVVVDYKTGDPDKAANAKTAPPNDKEPLGGEYWRQMVFYKLLIENYADRNWQVKMGMFDFVEKGHTSGEFKRVYVPVFPKDEDIVRQQLKDAWARIMNHEFNKGCGKEDCHWCNFARRYELVRPSESVVTEIDDV